MEFSKFMKQVLDEKKNPDLTCMDLTNGGAILEVSLNVNIWNTLERLLSNYPSKQLYNIYATHEKLVFVFQLNVGRDP